MPRIHYDYIKYRNVTMKYTHLMQCNKAHTHLMHIYCILLFNLY